MRLFAIFARSSRRALHAAVLRRVWRPSGLQHLGAAMKPARITATVVAFSYGFRISGVGAAERLGTAAASSTASGLVAGLHAGYNWQRDSFVFGLESDLSERSIQHNVCRHGGAGDDGHDECRCRLVWHLSRPPRFHDRSRAALRDRRACLRRYQLEQRHELARSLALTRMTFADASRLGRRRRHRVYGASPTGAHSLPFNMSTSVRRASRALASGGGRHV